jgi:predicted transposase YdaD
MLEYDTTLKNVLTRRTGSVLRRLTGLEVARWHNAELPEVRSLRADLLGETARRKLIHIELQSTNDPRMALRMLDYGVAIHRSFNRFPEQLVLYVGQAPLRMERSLAGPGISFECRIADIRDLDSEPLLESPSLEDNVIAVLARLSDETSAVRRILENVSRNEPSVRAGVIAELMILAGLRDLGEVVEREMKQMPILNDIMDHPVIGRDIKRGRAEGERFVILSLIAKRFGPVPASARQHIESLAVPELEQLALRVLDAQTLEDLLA